MSDALTGSEPARCKLDGRAPPAASLPQDTGYREKRVTRESQVDTKTDRKFFLDFPADHAPGQEVTFILNLHGGGSAGTWQRQYFPVCDFVDQYKLVVAAPTAATAEPMRHWAPDADDARWKDDAQ